MEIIKGKTSGFCYGVKRAVEGATNEVTNCKEKVYCLGELVHNNQVIEKLEKLGIKFVKSIDEVNGITIIRAHGVPKEIYDIAKMRNIEIRDFSCPNVLKIHDIVKEYNKNGYFIFLLGNKTHPENVATLSYCENYYVIEDENDINKAMEKFKSTDNDKLLLIAQTTYSIEKYNKIEDILKHKIEENITFVTKNTICRATELRQKETDELSKQVDGMIIIGGKNSSNTKKLYEIANKNCSNTVIIEIAQELQPENIENFKKMNKVGIMAGASTPQESIDEVIKILSTNC